MPESAVVVAVVAVVLVPEPELEPELEPEPAFVLEPAVEDSPF